MTRDDILRMARKAGWPSMAVDNLPGTQEMSRLERFAALVAAAKDKEIAELTAERDALLAKLQWIADQEQTARDCMNAPGSFAVVLATCAADAIRARGEK